MDEQVKELRHLDGLDTTDLWDRIQEGRSHERPQTPVRGRRFMTAAFAIMIAAGGVGVTLYALTPRERPPGGGTAATNGPLVFVRIEKSDSPYGGPTSVWSIQPEGSDLREIEQPVPLEDPLQAFTPRWSPDGSRVLWWAGDGHFVAGSIWTDVPGRGMTPIVSCELPSCGIWDPEWSPDGTTIAFARGITIVAVEPDGSEAREIARCPSCTGMESGPSWSPDGSRIAFAASDAEYHGAIFVMDADGSDLTRVFDCGSQLCQGGLRAASLDWSPTDDRLVFTLERNVWTMRPDGTELRQLTSCPETGGPNACEPGVVTWSPDGTKIAYDLGTGGLVIMHADGSDPREIGPGGQLYLDSWQPVPGPRTGTYMDPTFGWSIEIPAGMTLLPIDDAQRRVTVMGAVISNVAIQHPETLSDLANLPSDGVVLRIWHNEGGPLGPVTEDDASFPLSIQGLRPIDRYVGGSEPQPLYRWFFAGGTDFNVAVWFGEGAREEAKDAIARALASLRPAPTEPGTVLHDRMIVLDDASSYELGSVTRYDRSDLELESGRFSSFSGDFSFHLVHAPNGFYAISTDFLGNGSRCDLRLDAATMTFSCPGTGWSWDRSGRALTEGEPWPDGTQDLVVLPAPVSWDGHVMVDPFGNAPDEAMEAWSE